MAKWKFLLLTGMLVLNSSQLFTAEAEKLTNVFPLPAGISIHMLDNGMQVLLIENPILPMTGINVAVKIGSAYENFATSGMSHMLEHLLFNGTSRRSQKQLYDDVALIGGYNNANTSYYYTNFMMVIPAQQTQTGMEIQADMLFNSVLPIDKFEKEKGIILEEIARDLNDPETEADNNIHSILFRNHSLSLPITGTYATIASMSRDEVYAYYKNTYLPNNMILTAIGPFNPDSMLVLIDEIYGKSKPSKVDYPHDSYWRSGLQLPEPQGDRSTTKGFHRFYNGEELLVQLFLEIPVQFSAVHLTLFDEIFEKNRDRIYSALQKKFPGAIKSLDFGNLHFPVKNFVSAEVTVTDEQKIQEITTTLYKSLSSLNLVLPPETVRYLATQARTEYILNLEKPHMFGIYSAETLVLQGIEAVFQEKTLSSFLEAEQELRDYRLDSKPVVLIQHPEKKEGRDLKDVTGPPQVFTDSSSGLVLIARQNPSGNLLAVHYLFKHKAKYESQFGKNAALILHDCIGQRLSSTTNQKVSNRFGLALKVNDDPAIPMDDIYLNPDFGYIRAEGLADDLPGVINYLCQQLNTFVPSRNEFNKALEKSHSSGGGGMSGIKSSDMFTSSYTNAVYEVNEFPDIVNEITYENLLKFCEVYLTPVNEIISVVAPATPASLYELFVKNLTIPVKNIIDQKPAYVRPLKILDSEVNNDFQGNAEQSYLFWGFTTEIQGEDRPAMEVFSKILADRIIFDVREKQGRAYRLNTGIDFVQDRALFYFRLGTRPANIDVLLPQIPGFFDLAMVNSITTEELDKTINQYLGRMMFRRLSSINQAYYMAYSLYFYGDCEHDQYFLEQLKQVTLDDIKRVAGKYMVIKNPVTVIMR